MDVLVVDLRAFSSAAVRSFERGFPWPGLEHLARARRIVVLAVAIGFLNGYLLVKTGLPSLTITLATFFVLCGVNVGGTNAGGDATAARAVGVPVKPVEIARFMTTATAGSLNAPDRTDRLAAISVPTRIIRGDCDRLTDPAGGRALHAGIPGSTLTVYRGVGHELPRGLWDNAVELLGKNVQRGESAYSTA